MKSTSHHHGCKPRYKLLYVERGDQAMHRVLMNTRTHMLQGTDGTYYVACKPCGYIALTFIRNVTRESRGAP